MKLSDISDLEVLIAVHDYVSRKTTLTPVQQLCDKYPENLVLMRMEKLVRKGFLDYGVSIRTAWVTDFGYKFMGKI